MGLTLNISEPSIRYWSSLPEPILAIFSISTVWHWKQVSTSHHQGSDIGQSIFMLTKAIYLPLTPVSRDRHSSFPNIVEIFYSLATGVLIRGKKSRRPEDVKCCIGYFRYLHRQWHDVSMKFPVPGTAAHCRRISQTSGIGTRRRG